jgi:exosortase
LSRISILVLGGLTLGPLVWFWGIQPDDADRILIVLASGYLLRQQVLAGDRAGWKMGFLLILVGLIIIPPVWNLLPQVGPRSILLWLLVLSLQAILIGWVLKNAGWAGLRRSLFPILFLSFALPLPDRVQAPLQRQLQTLATDYSSLALRQLGYPATQLGFAIDLPHGRLEVVEACSGIRSTTALTALAAFLAYWQGLGLLRGLFLLLMSQPIIVLANLIRITSTGIIQEEIGKDYIHGTWHDILGFATVLIGLGLILMVAHPLRSRAPTSETNPALNVLPRLSRLENGLIILTATAAMLSLLLGANQRSESRESVDFDQIPLRFSDWIGKELPVDQEILAQLSPDQVSFREYRDPFGVNVVVWLLYWENKTVMKGYHHPDVCWPNRGFQVAEAKTEPTILSGRNIPMTVRSFVNGTEKHRIFYWTQEGKRFWSEVDEQLLREGGSQNWFRELLYRQNRGKLSQGRIAVLVGLDRWTDSSQQRKAIKQLLDYLTISLYQTCSWADPNSPRDTIQATVP